MSEYQGDFLIADEKIDKGTDWQDTMSIPVAGQKLEFGFSLLNERARQNVQNTLPIDEYKQYKQDGMSDEQQRMMKLQRKDDLSSDEQEELLELAQEVNPEEEGRDKLGDDAVDALMEAGKKAIEPTDGDVQDAMALSPDKHQEMFGEVIEGGHEQFRDAMAAYMRERIEGQPFPIKFSLGQRAYMETMAVAGNGFQET